jgi:protease-4
MKDNSQKRSKWKFVLMTLAIFFVLSWIIASVMGIFIAEKPFGNVALIPITGAISTTENGDFGEAVSSSTDIVSFIEDADKNPDFKAIVFEINSPGGSAVASKEIVDAINRVNKTTYALIREIGTSGAYWAASATDKIIADPLSITGSIGVISSYLEFSGLLNKYNVTYQRLIAGKYKDIGSPLKKITGDEEEILIAKLNKIHSYFINSVAENRKMDVNRVRQLATGEFFLGEEALQNGLIDVLGNKETAKEMLKKELNLTEVEFAKYEKPKSFFEELAGVFSENSFMVGKGIGSELKEASTINEIKITT